MHDGIDNLEVLFLVMKHGCTEVIWQHSDQSLLEFRKFTPVA